jgi:hypothetical protein
MIAAEQTGRVCYGMEIDPRYCDVIVRRWEEFTGRKAVLDGNEATPKAAERVLRERKGIALRLAGATYEEIGEQLEMSESGAYRLVRRCLDRERARTEEDAETLRQIDLMRVERAILALWAQVKAGHLGAIDRLLRCLDIRAKYLGL